MSVHYLIDGYNAIYRIPQLAGKKNLREAREALLRLLKVGNFVGSPRNCLTIVFDGKPDVCYDNQSQGVRVVFATGQTADDLIKEIVEKASAKKNIYAITDDKALAYSVRDLGAKTISVSDFFATIMPKAITRVRKRGRQGAQEEKYIPETTAFKINDELKEIWLK